MRSARIADRSAWGQTIGARVLWLAVALTAAVIVSGCSSAGASGSGSSSPTFTDAFGYSCTIQQAEPYGFCPSDHHERIGGITYTASNGVACDFTAVNPETGACPPTPVTDSAGNECQRSAYNAVTKLCNDPTVTDSQGQRCFKSQVNQATNVCNDQSVTDSEGENCYASEINPKTELCDPMTTASGDGETCRTSQLVSGADGYDCDYKLP
jgi:hypothetical protein